MRAGFQKTGKYKLIVLLPAFSAIFIFSTFSAHARFIAPVQGLEMLRRSFSGVADFTADITQDKQISLMKKTMKASGVVRFRKPDTFYMELYSPYASRVLLRDTSLTMILPGEGTRQKIILPREESLKRWITVLDSPVSAVPAGVDISAESQGKFVTLKITPRKSGSVKEFRITFLENGGISRLVIEERNNDRTVINFRNMRKNVGLTERNFFLE